MTIEQAKQCYRAAGFTFDHSPDEWAEIRKELEVVVSAKSDLAAGKTILWWGCWDKKLTATAYARLVRDEYAKIARGK